jgi:uncharacterized damage-inducible protein DinB
MDPRLGPLAAIFDLNADLLAGCASDLTEDQANRRLEAGGNSIAFLVAHLTDVRHVLADLLGAPLPNPVGDALAGVRSIDEVESLPPLGELLSAWTTVSAHLSEVFAGLTAAELDARTTQPFPIPGGTALDAVAFLAQHDSYHLGQVAFLRRQLGLSAMSYRRP